MIFFARTVWTISLRTINIIKNQNVKNEGLLLYKSRNALNEDFLTGKMLSGVIVKLPGCDENIYVCYEER